MMQASNLGISKDKYGNWITNNSIFDSKYSILGSDMDDIFYVAKHGPTLLPEAEVEKLLGPRIKDGLLCVACCTKESQTELASKLKEYDSIWNRAFLQDSPKSWPDLAKLIANDYEKSFSGVEIPTWSARHVYEHFVNHADFRSFQESVSIRSRQANRK